jgi:lipoprotein-releasing system permease protein
MGIASRFGHPHRPAREAVFAVNSRWLPFEWIAAVRFLGEGRLQTAFIVGGISIGVAVIVFMSAMLAGLQANFINRVLTSQSHIQLIPPDQVARPLRGNGHEFEDAAVQRPSQRILSIDQWPKMVARLQAMPEVTAVSPTMSGSALAVRGQASRAITLTGVDPATYYKIVRLPNYLVAGSVNLSSEDIIVGTELAKNLGATLGDKINVQAASGAAMALRIVGVLDLGNKGLNQRNAYVALRTAQALIGMIGAVTTIEATVTDIYAAEVLAQQIQAANYVEADSWIATNAQFFTAVQAQATSNTLIRVFVALSVAFGIAAVLVVSVIQRSKDIGILRAMGASQGQIERVFLIQGALLAFVGSLIGSALGAGALIYWHSVARQVDGTELFPLILERQLFIYTAVLATLTGLLAATAPALRAAKLDPVEAIRG